MTKSLLFRAAVDASTTSPRPLPSEQICLQSQPIAQRFRRLLSAQFLVLACCLLPVASARAQLTIMKSTQRPAVIDTGDTHSVEVGVKFKADSNGTITGLRFYKAAANTGTHVGHLWSTSGTRAGQRDFHRGIRIRLATGQLRHADRRHCKHYLHRIVFCARRTLLSGCEWTLERNQ